MSNKEDSSGGAGTEDEEEASADDLDGRLQELHTSLSKLKRESEDKIEKLKRESEDASKTIEHLQQRLQQQSDYELLKREIQ